MKKLLVLAVAAGLSATAAADATLYGQLHASLDAVDGATDSTSVSSNSSRIGVKGSVELAGGMKGIYKAEWGMDTGGAETHTSSTIGNRNQVVGVAGGFGAVLLGRHDTPFKTVGRKLDLGWSTQIGSNYNMVARGKGVNWDIRPNNVVAYQTPKMGGFQGMLAYVTEHSGNDKGALSVNGIYSAGALSVLAGYESHDKTWYGGAEDESAIRLGATYKMGNTKLVGMYQAMSDEGGTAGADRDIIGIGAATKVSSAGTIKGQYYTADGDAATDEADMLSIGYDHALSKSTTVYAQYSTIDGNGSDLYQMGTYGRSDGTKVDASGDATGFSLGIRQTF